MNEKTKKEKLKQIIAYFDNLSNQSNIKEIDNKKILSILRLFGFNNCKIVSGIVYLEGRGTINAPPQSIFTIIKILKQRYIYQLNKIGV
jgi:hypothetical protein